MPTRPRPSCLALLVCDSVVTDRATGKISILGTFGEILADGLPVVVPHLTVYAELTNGHGDTTVVLRLSRAIPKQVERADDVSGQTLAAWELHLDFDSPTRIYNLHITAVNVVLLDFGDYRFSIEVEGTSIMERCISVTRRDVK
jgi:hypothetical protein